MTPAPLAAGRPQLDKRCRACRLTAVLLALVLPLLCAGAANAGRRPAYRGVQLHSLWWGTNYRQMQRELDLARRAKSTAVRVDIAWSSLQTDSRNSFSPWYVHKLDAFIAGARARRLKVIATVYSTPCWASRAPEPLKNGCTGSWWDRGVTAYPPVDDADFAAIVQWVTARYGRGLAAVEIWNEPNAGNQRFWNAPDAAAAYAHLLRAAYPAAKRGNRSVRVLGGSLASTDEAFLTRLYRAGIKGSYDGLAVHPYTGARGPNDAGRDGQWTLGPGLRSLRALQAAHNDRAPIWATEFGWSTARISGGVSRAKQASYIASAYRIMNRLSFVRGAIVYNLRNLDTDARDAEANFGLVTENFARKPAYWAFARAMGRRRPGARSTRSTGAVRRVAR